MSTRLPLLATVAAVAIAATSAASAATVDDVRLLGGLGRGTVGGTADANNNTSHTKLQLDGDADVVGDIAVAGMTSFGELGPRGGVVAGLQIGWRTASSENHADAPGSGTLDLDRTTNAIMADVLFGYAFAFGPAAHVEITPFLGLGREEDHLEVHSTGGTVQPTGRSWGTASEYGLRAAAYRTFANRLQIGFEVRYAREESSERTRISITGTESAFEIDQHTDILELVLGIGRRF